MEIDGAKENIQPLSSGRNAGILQATLQNDAVHELHLQRQQLEQAIHDYDGDDPLEPWYNYIDWIEQSYPSAGKDSGLEEVLKKCLRKFGGEERYFQDQRIVKLYNKFIAYHKTPLEVYESLYNSGVGTMVADFYISWAYYYDLANNTRKADEIFKRGIACRAEPLDVLKEAHQHYGYIISQRILYDDDQDTRDTVNQQLQDRRFALTSLRGLRKKSVIGSIRTGSVVKSFKPGVVQSAEAAASGSNRSSRNVPIFHDENVNHMNKSEAAPEASPECAAEVPTASTKTIVNSIIDAVHNQENEREAGPWNKAHNKKYNKLFSKETKAKDIGFNIHEDGSESHDKFVNTDVADDNLRKPFKYPPNFARTNRKPQEPWATPVTTENAPDRNTLPQYNKLMLYPRPNMEFQPEELRLYRLLKRLNVNNAFVQECVAVWSNGADYNVRQYPNFATKSAPKVAADALLESYFEPPKLDGLKVPDSKLYNAAEQTEYQCEELLLMKVMTASRNTTNMEFVDMEETMIVPSGTAHRRKSFFPMRKSIAPPQPAMELESLSPPSSAVAKNALGANSHLAVPRRFPRRSPEAPVAAPDDKSTRADLQLSAIREFELSLPKMPALPERPVDAVAQASVQREFARLSPEAPAVVPDEKPAKADLQPPAINCKLLSPVIPAVAKNPDMQSPLTREFLWLSPEMPAAPEKQIKSEMLSPVGRKFDLSPPKMPADLAAEAMKRPTDAIGFEIYEDPTQLAYPAAVPSAAAAVAKDDDFKFPQPNAVCSAFDDDDETCSTQIFTNFVRAQPASTPNAPQKSAAVRGILRDVVPKYLKPDDDDCDEVAAGIAPIGLAENERNSVHNEIAPYSMQQTKQLSTILETSEHGTHTTTSGSTKSLITSPPMDMVEYANVHRPYELEPLNEQSFEVSSQTSSSTGTTMKDVKPLPPPPPMPTDSKYLCGPMEQQRLAQAMAYTTTNTSIKELQAAPVTNAAETPFAMRLCQKDSNEPTQPATSFLEIGNFTRLVNRDDSIGDDFAVAPVHFQVDKTETMSKILHASQHATGGKFQDDKTETFAKMLLSQPTKFQDDKTATIPFIPYNVPHDPVNMDSFEILSDTASPGGMKTDVDNAQMLSSITKSQSFATNKNTANNNDSKSLTTDNGSKCKTSSDEYSIASFRDYPGAAEMKCLESSAPSQQGANLQDSLLPDFSFVAETQPLPPITKAMESMQIDQQAAQPKSSLLGEPQRKRNESLHLFNKDLFDPPYMQSFNSTTAMHKPDLSINEQFELSLVEMEKEMASAAPRKLEIFNASNLNKTDSIQPSHSISKATQPPVAAENDAASAIRNQPQQQQHDNDYSNMASSMSNYIYKDRTLEIPTNFRHSWDDDFKTLPESGENSFVHCDVDLNRTDQLIENIRLDPNVNPFEGTLISAFLDSITFTPYIKNIPTCQMMQVVPRLTENSLISINNEEFRVQKLIGSGAYGVVYSGMHVKTGQRYAFKQEKPPNLWEYYICLEVETRLASKELLCMFGNIEYALIGNNATIYISKFSPFGSLVNVSNGIRKYTNKYIDELVVMVLVCELLDIIDHLHALNIIHADVKADNFLLMCELSYPQKWPSLQLIDFGVSIDMKLFQPGQHFTYTNKDKDFKCVEMREGRPWTYQLDLYGMADVIHMLLFGKYMEMEKLPNGTWMHTSYVPRYFHKNLWHDVFKTLLNIPDCNSQPNLQRLRVLLKEALVEKEKLVKEKIVSFNTAIKST